MTCAVSPYLPSLSEAAVAVPRSLPPRTAKSEARRLQRRRVYLGEGLTLQLASEDERVVEGEVIDLTPAGIGVALVEGEPSFAVGDVVSVRHTGRATSGLCQRAVVRSISKGTFGGRVLPRVGLAFIVERTLGEVPADRRRANRYTCPESMTPIATAMSPLFFREWLHFEVVDVAAGGFTMTTSIRNKGLLLGLIFDFEVTLPVVGRFEVRGRITSVRREVEDNTFVVGVAWVDPPRKFQSAVSEYLMFGDKDLSPSKLRADGFVVGSVERAVTYDYASRQSDYEAILRLRLAAHQDEGRFTHITEDDLVSSYDEYARHLVCRFGDRIVGYSRLIYVEGDASRSELVAGGGHAIPEEVWKAGYLEVGASAVDPEFKRAGLYLPLVQHILRVVAQSGYRYLVGGCCDEHLPMYRQMGWEVLESREVEPLPGWKFRSNLLMIDLEKMDAGNALRPALTFVHSSPTG